MRRGTLLTQVLVVNLLLIAAAVIAASIASNPDNSLARQRHDRARPRLRPRRRPSRSTSSCSRTPLRAARAARRRDGAGRPLRADRRPPATSRAAPRRSQPRARRSARCSSGSRPSGARRHAALDAQERERARIARDLHDEVNQSLTGAAAADSRRCAARHRDGAAADELAETGAGRRRAMEELLDARPRGCGRRRSTTSGSRPRSPTLVEEVERRAGIVAGFESEGDVRQPPRRRPARRLPGRPGGALERGPARRRRAPPGPPDRRRRRRWSCGSPTTAPASTPSRAGERPRDRRDARAGAARRRRARGRIRARRRARG